MCILAYLASVVVVDVCSCLQCTKRRAYFYHLFARNLEREPRDLIMVHTRSTNMPISRETVSYEKILIDGCGISLSAL